MVEAADLTDDEREAIHEVERGTEWIHRAHGLLVEFHHAVGHAMDHYDEAADALADEHPGLAGRLDDEVLPAGLTEDGHLSYRLVGEFEEGFLATVEDVADEARVELVDGERYVVEAARHGEASGGANGEGDGDAPPRSDES